MAVSFRYRLLDEFLKEWQLRKKQLREKQLREGEITKEEYLEWKLNWPQTACPAIPPTLPSSAHARSSAKPRRGLAE